MNPRPDLPAPGPDGSISEQLVGWLEAGDVAAPTTGETAAQPPGWGRCAGADGWVQRGPSMHQEAAPRASCSLLGARSGAAPRPSSRLLPSRRAAGQPRALRRLGLPSALQQGGGGGGCRLPDRGLWCLHPWRGPRCPASPLSQGCPPASAHHSRAGPHAPLPLPAGGRGEKAGRRPEGPRCGLREAAEAQWPTPVPPECPPGVRAPPGPAPGPRWPGRQRAITPAGSVPGRPTCPPARPHGDWRG